MHQSEGGMQEVIQMCSSFDTNKSTKGASKLRRDLINGEIANLRDLLPLPSSTRQRLSQLQLMALVCVYVRKANYFQQVFKRFHELAHPYSTPNIGFSKALSGFLIMMTQNGKLLYISDNAAEYLGHSMEDLLIHGDSVYDIIDKADHGTVQAELLRNSNSGTTPSSSNLGEEMRLFLCRMNVSRNARRQMRFGDQKVVLLQGHYLSYLPLCSRNEPVFVATCTPVAMPETRECVVQGATNVFTTIHSMDMKYIHIDRNGEYYLGYTRSELGGISWYQLLHWNYMREAQSKHRLISQSEQEKSCILLLKMETRNGNWIWVHCVLQVKDGSDSGSNSSSNTTNPTQTHSVIVATNQVLSEREASVMRANVWIYHYYTVQTKLQYGLAYAENSSTSLPPPPTPPTSSRIPPPYFPTPQFLNYTSPPTSHLAHCPQISPEGASNGVYHYGAYYQRPMGEGLGGGVKDTPIDFSLSLFDNYNSTNSSYWANHNQTLWPSHSELDLRVASGSSMSPNNPNSTRCPAPSPKKKSKKSNSSNSNDTNGIRRYASSLISHGTPIESGSSSVATLNLHPYQQHNRNFYKLEDGIRRDNDNSSFVSCPLTPSPIWEGQTQRVPDLHNNGIFNENNLGSYSSSGTHSELIHCVPTYANYFYTPHYSSIIGPNGMSGGTTIKNESPNKENRLPPTPDSSDHDGDSEESRPLKWETL